MAPFIVFTLPRSRSAWLSHFLASGDAAVGHDLALNCAKVEDFFSQLETRCGTVETGAILGAGLIRQMRPDIRFAVVLRPVDEIMRSLAEVGLVPAVGEIEHRAELLRAFAQEPGVLALGPADLDEYEPCNALMEHCRGVSCSYERWDHFRDFNIQLNIPRRLAKLNATAANMASIKEQLGRLQENHASSC